MRENNQFSGSQKSPIFIFHIFIISVIIILLFRGSLNSYFVASDYHMIPLSNYDNWENYSKLFWGDSIHRAQGEGGYFRPLYIVSLTIDYFFWKLNPFGYHLTNIIIHILTTALVYVIASHIIRNRTFGFIAALLFAAHPLHTETVAYISGRVSSLATLFYLLSLFLFIRSRSKGSLWILSLSLFAFVLSLGTKEIAATLPAAVFLYEFIYDSESKSTFYKMRAAAKKCLPFIIVLSLYLVFRFLVLGRVAGIDTDGVVERTPLQFDVIMDLIHFFQHTFYLLIPVDAGINIATFLIRNKYLYAGISGIWLMGIIFIFLKFILPSRTLTFSFLWILITFFIVHQFPINPFNLWGARFMYLPSAAFCIFVASIFYKVYASKLQGKYLFTKSNAVYIMCALIVAFYSALLIEKIERMDKGAETAKRIVNETIEYLPAEPNEGTIYFVLLPASIDGASVFGPVDKAIHFFHGSYRNVDIKQLLMVREKSSGSPDIKTNFRDDRTLEVEIGDVSPWEYFVNPWAVTGKGQKKESSAATITNLMTDTERNITRLKIELKKETQQKNRYFFLYQNGHIYPIEDRYVTVHD